MRIFLILLAAFFPAAALAQTPMPASVAGNLPSGFYVQSPCIKPDKKAVGTPANDPQQMAYYNFKVTRFNKAVAVFNVCAKTYLDNSRTDIARILSTVNTEVAAAQGSVPPPPPAALGNMPADFYPHSSCAKPDQVLLGTQPSTSDHKAMVAYNLKVQVFNEKAVTFNTCLKAYQVNAQHDIQEIQAAAHAATADGAIP